MPPDHHTGAFQFCDQSFTRNGTSTCLCDWLNDLNRREPEEEIQEIIAEI